LGFDNIRVIHANDSKTPLGSHVDRHQHIGGGYIGEEGFRRILSHPKLRDKPFIAETPVDQDDDDRRNVQKLISLCRKSRTTTKKSS
jgi:deoxyribonuclease IV